jgi:hypothetical protein
VVPSNATVLLSEMGKIYPFTVYGLPASTTMKQAAAWFMKYDPPGQHLGDLTPNGPIDVKRLGLATPHYWCNAQHIDYLWMISDINGHPDVTIGKGGTDRHCPAA